MQSQPSGHPQQSGSSRVPRLGTFSLTEQTWSAGVSAVIFVISTMIIAFTPIPYLVWQPGSTADLLAHTENNKPVVDISGTQAYPSSGRMLLLTVRESRLDSVVALPEALWAHWTPQWDVLPKDKLYPPGKSSGELRQEDAEMMNTSQEDAVVAGLRAAGQELTEVVRITKVVKTGPAHDHLLPGDTVLSVDSKDVATPEEVRTAILKHAVGESITFALMRNGARKEVSFPVHAGNQNKSTPVVGAEFSKGFAHPARVEFGIDSNIGGPSAGLMFSLAVYDRVTPGDLIAGRTIAGTGTITPDGAVGPVGGVQEKSGAADKEHAEIMLIPAANCADIAGAQPKARIVKVTTLQDAIDALKKLQDPTTAKDVPSCS